jgi:CelD/BcsL family acetyltransferase involved in cellulose biosynthesis
MAARGDASMLDGPFTDGLVALARDCGRVIACYDGDRIIAGSISAATGTGWTLMVIAHDPAFDEHSLGMLCATWTVEAAIRAGAPTFSLMWGSYEYKARLTATPVSLVDLRFYRSLAAQLADWPVMLPVYAARLRRAYHAARRRLHLGRFLPGRARQA